MKRGARRLLWEYRQGGKLQSRQGEEEGGRWYLSRCLKCGEDLDRPFKWRGLLKVKERKGLVRSNVSQGSLFIHKSLISQGQCISSIPIPWRTGRRPCLLSWIKHKNSLETNYSFVLPSKPQQISSLTLRSVG